jgi:hypothetical protein
LAIKDVQVLSLVVRVRHGNDIIHYTILTPQSSAVSPAQRVEVHVSVDLSTNPFFDAAV